MKLTSGFITYEVGDSHVAVATETVGTSMNGMIRSNDTAAFILELLKEETTEEKIIEALLDKYNVSEETATTDVHRIIAQLRDEGYIED